LNEPTACCANVDTDESISAATTKIFFITLCFLLSIFYSIVILYYSPHHKPFKASNREVLY